MTKTDSRTVVSNFFQAWTQGDFVTARGLLHDDVTLDGPTEKLDGADNYLASLRAFVAILAAAEEQKTFVDGDDVCVIYDFVTNTPAGTAPTAEWCHVRDGRISAVRLFFDARPFAPTPSINRP